MVTLLLLVMKIFPLDYGSNTMIMIRFPVLHECLTFSSFEYSLFQWFRNASVIFTQINNVNNAKSNDSCTVLMLPPSLQWNLGGFYTSQPVGCLGDGCYIQHQWNILDSSESSGKF